MIELIVAMSISILLMQLSFHYLGFTRIFFTQKQSEITSLHDALWLKTYLLKRIRAANFMGCHPDAESIISFNKNVLEITHADGFLELQALTVDLQHFHWINPIDKKRDFRKVLMTDCHQTWFKNIQNIHVIGFESDTPITQALKNKTLWIYPLKHLKWEFKNNTLYENKQPLMRLDSFEVIRKQNKIQISFGINAHRGQIQW